jgi:hypothetical protein
MLGLALLLRQMVALAEGRRWPFFAMPALMLVWVNAHGGVLAGLLLLGVATVTTAGQRLVPGGLLRRGFEPAPRSLWRHFFVVFALSLLAALATPWGFEGLRWLVESVRYVRPEITEWRPTPFDFSHATFWATGLLSSFAWIASRRGRPAWAAAVLVVLFAMACRHQRHIPLFCLANLALTPTHLLDAFRRLRAPTTGLRTALRSRTGSFAAIAGLLALGATAVAASFLPPRQRPWTIEVERDQFPCAALEFLKAHPLRGNLLVFFDWGQQAMWELPENRVSFDGRLDTIYSRTVIEAHWKFYRGIVPAPAVLNLSRADVALLPSSSPSVNTLRSLAWTPVYRDPLATILVRDARQHGSVASLVLPVVAGDEAVRGREPFPRGPSLLAHPDDRAEP